MSDKVHNLIFYLFVAFVSVFLTYWFNTLQDNVLAILLYPHALITKIFYNIPLVYVAGIGYASIDNTFVIGRECMGSKFIVMLFGMTACMFAKYFKNIMKAIWFIASLSGALSIGILISCIRIIGSIPLVAHPKFPLFHSGIGISLYLLTLTISYAALNTLVRSDPHEKNI